MIAAVSHCYYGASLRKIDRQFRKGSTQGEDSSPLRNDSGRLTSKEKVEARILTKLVKPAGSITRMDHVQSSDLSLESWQTF